MKTTPFNKRVFWSCLFWGWVSLIVVLTAMPYNPDNVVKDRDFWVRPDYVEHLSFYLILAVLFVPYYLTRERSGNHIRLLLWIVAGILFAAITEFYQLYIPNRAFNYWDMFLNIGGIFFGILLGFYLFRKKNVYKGP